VTRASGNADCIHAIRYAAFSEANENGGRASVRRSSSNISGDHLGRYIDGLSASLSRRSQSEIGTIVQVSSRTENSLTSEIIRYHVVDTRLKFRLDHLV